MLRKQVVVNNITVKPVLTATSEQRPPVNNGQTKSGQANFDTNLAVPRVAVVDRFDCILN